MLKRGGEREREKSALVLVLFYFLPQLHTSTTKEIEK